MPDADPRLVTVRAVADTARPLPSTPAVVAMVEADDGCDLGATLATLAQQDRAIDAMLVVSEDAAAAATALVARALVLDAPGAPVLTWLLDHLEGVDAVMIAECGVRVSPGFVAAATELVWGSDPVFAWAHEGPAAVVAPRYPAGRHAAGRGWTRRVGGSWPPPEPGAVLYRVDALRGLAAGSTPEVLRALHDDGGEVVHLGHHPAPDGTPARSAAARHRRRAWRRTMTR